MYEMQVGEFLLQLDTRFQHQLLPTTRACPGKQSVGSTEVSTDTQDIGKKRRRSGKLKWQWKINSFVMCCRYLLEKMVTFRGYVSC